MALAIVIPAVLTLIGAGWVAQSRRTPKAVSPEVDAARRHIYIEAMTGKDIPPTKLREISAECKRLGMKAEADMLIKRAELAEAPPELKKARREVLKKLLACEDIEKITNAADVFESMGGFGAAHCLRERANALTILKNEQSTEPTAENEVQNEQVEQ